MTMEKNYSETLYKAKTYFKKIIKERERHMQQISLSLPKRIEIQTLPLSTSTSNEEHKVIEKFNKPETKEHYEPEYLANSKLRTKKSASNHGKTAQAKIESFNLVMNMNYDSKRDSCRIRSSSNTIIESLSVSTITDSPVSTSIKISTSSSTARINQKCQEAIAKAKTYFQNKERKFRKKTRCAKNTHKVNESTCTKEDHINKINPENVEIIEINTTENHINEHENINSKERKKTFSDAKKSMKSKLGIDQKSITVKKENKDIFSLSKTHVYRISTKIKSFPNATKEIKKAVNQKENLNSGSPQFNIQTAENIHLTPAKRYLRSKLGLDEKTTSTKKDSTKLIQNPLEQNKKTDIQTVQQPESSVKPNTKLNTSTPTKVRPPSSPMRPISRNRETNLKKLSTANDNVKRERRQSKFTNEKGLLSAKTNIVTSIEPGSRETNKISIELKKPVVLTSSMEGLLSKALKIGLKKINRSDLQDLQLKIRTNVQSRNNLSGLESSIISERSDLASMQSKLESKISDFQTEMERRQRQTFDKIQELEDTIQFRRRQLMEINKSKNTAIRK